MPSEFYVQSTDEIFGSSAFLDRMNETLFKPRGLIGMITTYKPDQKSSTVGVDMFRSSGTANGELQLPEAAALVFPEDEAREGRKNPSSFTADYSDKPSHATCVSAAASLRNVLRH